MQNKTHPRSYGVETNPETMPHEIPINCRLHPILVFKISPILKLCYFDTGAPINTTVSGHRLDHVFVNDST